MNTPSPLAQEVQPRPRVRRRPAIALVSLLACSQLAACAPTNVYTGVDVPSGSANPQLIRIPLHVAAPPKPTKTVQSFMTDHYFITAWARMQVMVGDLTSLHEPLVSLAEYRCDAPELERWKPWLLQLQDAAMRTASAHTITAAASGIASMGMTCGECHRATGGGPPVLPARTLETLAAASRTDRMRMHNLAADRLWDGLTAPSEAAWNAGASWLATMSAKDDTSASDPHYAGEFAKLKAFGTRAQELRDAKDRAQLFGAVLATCGHCHVKSQASFAAHKSN
ncbi:MAG: hypothetical protein RL701_6554 [Pseudomonadota bacterium]|jgi:hypothetical protein